MSLITCHECGKQVSDKAVSCAGCGAPVKEVQPVTVKKGSKNVGCVTVIISLFIVFYIASKFTPSAVDNSTSRTSAGLSILAPIKSFIVEHPEFGKPRSTSNVPDWRFGQRQRVVFESGRNLLFYIHEGEVISVYEDSPTNGRELIWGEYFDPENDASPH